MDIYLANQGYFSDMFLTVLLIYVLHQCNVRNKNIFNYIKFYKEIK